MAAQVLDSVLLASKFRGCLVGVLLGDCLGSPYEGEPEVRKHELQKYLDKLDGPYFKIPYKGYTDDTAMTRCVAESLLEHSSFNAVDMAKKFVKEYFNSPNRGYGSNVVTVFNKLRGTNFKDPFGPAREQFDGLGSYGNGAAMRISPVALFCYNDIENMKNVAAQSSEITHSNKLGINGAILQTLAVHKCLGLDSSKELDVSEFCNYLLKEMEKVEKDNEEHYGDEHLYQDQIKEMIKLLGRENPSEEMVVNKLGHSLNALYSVPTAIYSFLRAQKSIPDITTDNPFRRTIQYAISLGGDTDTIASMAGAVAGAYYGHDVINKSLQQHCEGTDYMIKLSDDLYQFYSMS